MPATRQPDLTIIPSRRRRHVQAGWYDSRQSFGGDNFGPLIVHNESVIAPESGFPLHGHEQMEIITWIFSGAMNHRDTEGNTVTIRPGLAQRMSAGSGIQHSEMNPSSDTPSRGVQMWVTPDRRAHASYAEAEVGDRLDAGGLVPIASEREPGAAVTLNRADTTFWAARLKKGQRIEVPRGSLVHLFVGVGSVVLLDGRRLSQGDVLRLVGSAPLTVAADAEDAEILIWQFV